MTVGDVSDDGMCGEAVDWKTSDDRQYEFELGSVCSRSHREERQPRRRVWLCGAVIACGAVLLVLNDLYGSPAGKFPDGLSSPDVLKQRNGHCDSTCLEKKKEVKREIALKMKELRDQINDDFSSMIDFGHKAGYLPPPKSIREQVMSGTLLGGGDNAVAPPPFKADLKLKLTDIHNSDTDDKSDSGLHEKSHHTSSQHDRHERHHSKDDDDDSDSREDGEGRDGRDRSRRSEHRRSDSKDHDSEDEDRRSRRQREHRTAHRNARSDGGDDHDDLSSRRHSRARHRTKESHGRDSGDSDRASKDSSNDDSTDEGDSTATLDSSANADSSISSKGDDDDANRQSSPADPASGSDSDHDSLSSEDSDTNSDDGGGSHRVKEILSAGPHISGHSGGSAAWAKAFAFVKHIDNPIVGGGGGGGEGGSDDGSSDSAAAAVHKGVGDVTGRLPSFKSVVKSDPFLDGFENPSAAAAHRRSSHSDADADGGGGGGGGGGEGGDPLKSVENDKFLTGFLGGV